MHEALTGAQAVSNAEEKRESLMRAHGALAELALHPGEEDPSDPSTVQAMPLVLHLEKNAPTPPQRNATLVAAAQACVGVCLHPAAGASQPNQWGSSLARWYAARIRKVARRARGKRWQEVCELPGVTAKMPGGEVRAFLPTPTNQVPQAINRLQIQGTELPRHLVPADRPLQPGSETQPPYPVIYVDGGLGMSLGKTAAQVGHAAMLYAGLLPAADALRWRERGFPLEVREVDAQSFQQLEQALIRRATLRTRWMFARDLATSPAPSAGKSEYSPAAAETTPQARTLPLMAPELLIHDAGHTEVPAGAATVLASAVA